MTTATESLTSFQTDPSQYRHWDLSFDGPVARLALEVREDEAQSGDAYALKQNSYDLGVDIELRDAIERIRFEHPEVRCLVITSALERVFCAGANIYMLGRSNHAFKVNFCKFTNETRLGIEDLSRGSGIKSIAALNGTAAGGGYELALACDEIYLVDDGNSAVSFPEVPLLAVLPGTGGLTRLVDKRKVRRDRADIFCTIAEGIKGRRAVEWDLVDGLLPRSSFAEKIDARAREISASHPAPVAWPGVPLETLTPEVSETGLRYRFVSITFDEAGREAVLTLRGPDAAEPVDPAAMLAKGSGLWALQAFRELDDALLHLRIDFPLVGVVSLRTEGEIGDVLRVDQALEDHREHGFVNEIRLLMARVLRRLDLTAKSLFALIEPGSCFAGSLFEMALAADRSYMLDDDDSANHVALSALNGGALPMSHGLTRLQARFFADAARPEQLLADCRDRAIGAAEAEELGLVTLSLDDLDYEDETRLALEERASLSPDALTGMEASLRFPGAENMDTKIFGRLSAWQNWIFQRPNAVGPQGALTKYGQPSRPEFDFRRT